MVTDTNRARHTPDTAFHERRTDRLVIRRFLAEDASSLAAYRSDPAIARYQGWDTPFTRAQARSFIDSRVDEYVYAILAQEWLEPRSPVHA